MKYLGIFLIIGGFGGIIGGEIVSGAAMLLIGGFLFVRFNKKKSINPVTPKAVLNNKDVFTFRVVGLTKNNDRGENIQSLIKEYVANEISMSGCQYDDMTNQEILDGEEDVYQVDLSGGYEVTLELNPDNPYDPNAIKVIHDEIGHVGYVPKELTSKVKPLLANGCQIDWRLIGGKKKYVDFDDNKVRTKNLTYGIEIQLIK